VLKASPLERVIAVPEYMSRGLCGGEKIVRIGQSSAEI